MIFPEADCCVPRYSHYQQDRRNRRYCSYMDELYDGALHVLQTKKPKEEKKVDHGQAQEDYYQNIRTK